MKYTLFFFFGFLCIIELNALNNSSKNTVNISSQPRNNAHTKKETSTKEIKGKNESDKSSPHKKKPDPIKERIKDIIPKVIKPTTKITTSGPKKKINTERNKIIDKIKEKLKEKIKNQMTEQETKKIIDNLKKKIKHPITDQEIKEIIDDLKNKKTHPIKIADQIMKKIIEELKRRRPITDPLINNLLEDYKRKHKISDQEMNKIIKDLKRRMKNPVIKPTRPVKQTTLPKNKNKENVKKIITFLKSKLGTGCTNGSKVQPLTPDLLKKLKYNYPEFKERNGKDSFDCSGLAMNALREAGINIHRNEEYTWAEDLKQRGNIKNMPKDKLCLLFKKNSNGKMTHIGIYIGNGKVIEAKNADYGIVETDLNDVNWTNWGIPAGLE